MYSPKVVERRLARLADSIRRDLDPRFEFTEHSVAEVDEWNERLDPIYDYGTGIQLRNLTIDEESWIRHEVNRCKVDFRYWCTHYAKIKDKNMSLIRLQPTAVQEFFLEKVAKAEEDAIFGKTGDGILFMVLKARQLGISTISDIIISHRSFFYGNTTAYIAADVDERTPNLYEMIVRCYENSPWWLRPRSSNPDRDYRVKNKQLSWADQDSVIRFGSSANLQGGDSGQEKGSLGTGMTLPLVHLSELALWSNPYQIDDALMPSIPYGPRTFAIFESTAKGRGNWWHEKWEAAKKGLGRRRPIFIPWYTDPNTYKLPSPVDWVPNERTLQHAERVRQTSPRWLGKTVLLTRDQLYWWERTRAEYVDGKILHKFLAEYTADDMEAFQNTTIGVFPSEMIDDMRQRASQMPILVEIKPKMKIMAENSGWPEGVKAPNA